MAGRRHFDQPALREGESIRQTLAVGRERYRPLPERWAEGTQALGSGWSERPREARGVWDPVTSCILGNMQSPSIRPCCLASGERPEEVQIRASELSLPLPQRKRFASVLQEEVVCRGMGVLAVYSCFSFSL